MAAVGKLDRIIDLLPGRTPQVIKGFMVIGESEQEVLDRVEKRARLSQGDVSVVGEPENLVASFNLQNVIRQRLHSQTRGETIGNFYRMAEYTNPQLLSQHGTLDHVLAPRFGAEVYTLRRLKKS